MWLRKGRQWNKMVLKHLLIAVLGMAFFGPPSLSAQERVTVIYPVHSVADSGLVFPLIRQGSGVIETDIDSALTLLKKAEQISRVNNFYGGMGLALAYMGLAETERGNYIAGFRYYEKALPYCLQAVHFPYVLAYLYKNMASSYIGQGELLKARTYFHQSLLAFEKYLPDSRVPLSIYNTLAGIQARLGSFERAFQYVDHVIRQTTGVKDQKEYLVKALSAKGGVYYAMEKPDSALYYGRLALKLARELDDPSLYQSCYLSIGQSLLKKKQNEEAAAYFKKVIGLYTGTSDILGGYIAPRYSLGAALSNMGKYKEAEKVVLEALAKAEETGLYENQRNGYAVLSGLYIRMGNLEAALKQVHQYMALKDSLTKIEKIRAIYEIDTRYQVALKDHALMQQELQIVRQQEKIRKTNLLIGGVGGGLLLFTTLGFAFYRYKRKIGSREMEIGRLKATMAGEEKERSRLSRELHDGIGGMLTGIKLNLRALQKQEDPITLPEKLEGIMEMLHGMGEELHITAHNLMPQVLQKQSLRQALEVYCSQLQTGGLDLQLQFHNDPDVPDKTRELAIYRIIQELIQNILKHAKASLAVIQIGKNGSLLCISAEDNGIGFDTELQHSGLGLKNIRMRVEALNGYYALSSSPGRGTTAYIEIDLK